MDILLIFLDGKHETFVDADAAFGMLQERFSECACLYDRIEFKLYWKNSSMNDNTIKELIQRTLHG